MQITASETSQKEEPVFYESTKKIEFPRQYTSYNAQITFYEQYFEGIQTIKYVHEFETDTDEILIKLQLNHDVSKNVLLEEEKDTSNTHRNQKKYIYITKAFVGTEEVTFHQEGDRAYLILNNLLHSGDEITIGLEFQGNIKGLSEEGLHAYLILPHIAVFEDGQGFIMEKEDVEADEYIEIADYTITMVTDADKSFVATGILTEKYILPEGQIKQTYEAKKVRGVGIYGGESLVQYRLEQVEGIDIIIYTNRVLDNKKLAKEIRGALQYYGDLLGSYPYEQFVLIDQQHKEGFSVYPGMTIGDLKVLETKVEEVHRIFGKQWLSYIIAHEPDERISISKGLIEYLVKRRVHTVDSIEKYFEYLAQSPYAQKEYLKCMKFFFYIEKTVGSYEWQNFLKEYYKEKSFKLSSYNGLISQLLQNTTLNSIRILEETEGLEEEREDQIK